MLVVFLIFVLYPIAALAYIPSFYAYISFVCILLVSFPFLISYRKVGEIERGIEPNFPKVPFTVIILGFFVGILNLHIIASNVGGSLIDLLSVDGIRAISVKSTEIRYEKSSTANSGNPYILAISLFLVFLSGLKSENSNRLYAAILFVPIALYTVLTTEKWPSFLGLVFFFSGVFYSNSLKDIIRFLSKNLKYIILLAVLVISTLMMRSGKSESIFTLVNLIFHYILSPFYGFGYWLINSYGDTSLSLGKYTFIGPLSFFPSLTGVFRNSGVFLDNYFVYGNVSNIYTGFRYLVQDFSILGLLLINTIISLFYCAMVRFGVYAISESIKLILVFCALLSLNVTIAVHNSVLLSIFMCTFYVFFCFIRKK